MKQNLYTIANYEQDNWVELLQLAEFAYNNSSHSSTLIMPFIANFRCQSVMKFRLSREIYEARVRLERMADSFAKKLRETHERLRKNLLIAQDQHRRHAGGKDIKFNVDDMVWLAQRHIRTTRPSKKLNYKYTGPFQVSQVINDDAYRVDLHATIQIQNIFHVS